MIEELAEYFRTSASERVAELRALLGGEPADVQAIWRHFHFFSGMGGTYGFPRISELGDRAEEMLIPVVRTGRAASREGVAEWRDLVEGIAAELR